MEDFLVKEFYKKMEEINLDVLGVVGGDGKIHTLGTDSKIIGRMFEMLTQPVLEEIAEENGLILKTPHSQTVYPDFIIMQNEKCHDKIAIDIKTTYIDRDESPIKFTLGSFGSYMRNNSKNIEYLYTDYVKHYVICFVYKRNDVAQNSKVFQYENRDDIVVPYYGVQYFIQEKYKIAGDRPGSGNTENIGSFVTKDINLLREGKGPFGELGEDIFDMYWKHYPKYRAEVKEYTTLEEFTKWFLTLEEKPALLYPYNYDDMVKRLKQYKKTHFE